MGWIVSPWAALLYRATGSADLILTSYWQICDKGFALASIQGKPLNPLLPTMTTPHTPVHFLRLDTASIDQKLGLFWGTGRARVSTDRTMEYGTKGLSR